MIFQTLNIRQHRTVTYDLENNENGPCGCPSLLPENVSKPQLWEPEPRWSLVKSSSQTGLGVWGSQENTGRPPKEEKEERGDGGRGEEERGRENTQETHSVPSAEFWSAREWEETTWAWGENHLSKSHQSSSMTWVDYIPPVQVGKLCNSWAFKLNIQKGITLIGGGGGN